MGPKNQGRGDAVARIFSSVTRKWSKPNIFSNLIFGYYYLWKNGSSHGMVTGEKVGPCAYDCASNTLFELDDNSYPCKFGARSIFVKDYLFVLCMNCNDEYLLKEYLAQIYQLHWVQVKVHEYFELNEVLGYEGDVELEMQLFGC